MELMESVVVLRDTPLPEVRRQAGQMGTHVGLGRAEERDEVGNHAADEAAYTVERDSAFLEMLIQDYEGK